MDSNNRGNWYLLTALILGLSLGLLYAWVLSPTSEVDTHPAALREDYKDIYRVLIARAFQANNNLPRAEARLALLNDEAPALELAAQAQRFLADEGDIETAKLLANLSAAIQSADQLPSQPTTAAPTDQVSASPTPSQELTRTANNSTETEPPSGTESAENTSTPEATEAPPFILQDASGPICDPTLGESLIQIYATNASGEGIPGVQITINWGLDEEEKFFTGLKPELGLGYADFEAEPGFEYEVLTDDSGVLVSELELPACSSDSGDSYWGSWEIYITHPN
jgi:hypothetical protein